ncbi:hypothetical protein [Alkaliphilus oremlandii]|nr:hypothetical protein [Alkaliphilus oremlandii]
MKKVLVAMALIASVLLNLPALSTGVQVSEHEDGKIFSLPPYHYQV